MLRDPGLVLGRWARFSGTFLNAKYDKFRLDIIEGLSQWSVKHALGVEPTEYELIVALRSMANAQAVGPDELSVELLKLGLDHDPTELWEFHRVIKLVWKQRKVPQRWRDAVIFFLHNKEGIECGNYHGIQLVAHAAKVFLEIVTRLSACGEAKKLLQEEKCGFRPHRLTTDYDPRGLQTIRVGEESARAAAPEFHRSA